MKYVSILTIALAFSIGCGSKAPETDVKEPVAAEPTPPPAPEPTEEEKKAAEDLKKLEADRAR